MSSPPKFSRSDELHFEAAQGWLGLGDVVSANEELDSISREFQEHPIVLLLRCEVCSKAKQWEAVAALADMLLKVAPREKQAWIHRSFALHELKRTQAAFDLLHPALEKFPRFWLVPYNLACYCAQLGQLPEARKWLARAIALGDQKAVTSLALEDKDLQPIHEDLKDR